MTLSCAYQRGDRNPGDVYRHPSGSANKNSPVEEIHSPVVVTSSQLPRFKAASLYFLVCREYAFAVHKSVAALIDRRER
jgi:hypothetical protein